MRVAYRVIVLFQATLLAPIVVWGGPIAELLFGEEFAESGDVLRWLAPFVFLSGLAPLVSLGANYLGLARRRAPIAIAAVALNIVVDLALIPRIGVIGAAIGTSLAYAVYVPAHVWLCWRELGLALRDAIVPVVRALAAAAAMAARAPPRRNRCARPVAVGRRRSRGDGGVRRDARADGRADTGRPAGGAQPRSLAQGRPVAMRLVHLAHYPAAYPGSFVPMLRAALEAARAPGWEVEAVLGGDSCDCDWVADLEAVTGSRPLRRPRRPAAASA